MNVTRGTVALATVDVNAQSFGQQHERNRLHGRDRRSLADNIKLDLKSYSLSVDRV